MIPFLLCIAIIAITAFNNTKSTEFDKIIYADEDKKPSESSATKEDYLAVDDIEGEEELLGEDDDGESPLDVSHDILDKINEK